MNSAGDQSKAAGSARHSTSSRSLLSREQQYKYSCCNNYISVNWFCSRYQWLFL